MSHQSTIDLNREIKDKPKRYRLLETRTFRTHESMVLVGLDEQFFVEAFMVVPESLADEPTVTINQDKVSIIYRARVKNVGRGNVTDRLLFEAEHFTMDENHWLATSLPEKGGGCCFENGHYILLTEISDQIIHSPFESLFCDLKLITDS